MKIKTTKKMRLDELIKYVWEKGINNEDYYSDLGNHVSVGVQTLLWTNGIIGIDDTFTVELEEELTEETEIKKIVCIRKINGLDNRILQFGNTSINTIIENDEKTIKMYAFNGDELTLIWSKDTGIPTEGVVEG